MKKILFAIFSFSFFGLQSQSNPTPQSLPYTQNFGTVTFNSMPTGMAAWQGGQRTTLAQAEASTPGADATLAGLTNTTTTGGVNGYAVSSNARAYIQQSSNASNGTNQLALSINTGTSTIIDISYQVELLNFGANTNSIGLVLQYHQGNVATSAWTTISTATLLVPGGAVFTTQTFTYNLSGLNASTNYQFRWATWRPGSGNSCGIGIDNISVTSGNIPTSTVQITAQDPNTPSAFNWAIGSTLNQFYWAAITPSVAAATLNSVTANMTGNYVAADIASNGFKLYYSSDATLIPAGDLLLGSQNSAKVGATETINWTGLSQNFASGSTGYIYATADVSGSASAGNTIAGSFGSNANIVFSPTVTYNSGNTYGSTTNKTFASLPTNPTLFGVNCSSEVNIKVDMNAPTVGTVLVFANTGTTFTAPTGLGSGFTGANSNYGLATNYPAVGGRLVYSGAGNNFTVTGLTIGQTYSLIAYSYSGSNWSSGTSVITGTAITQPVTATVVTPSSGQINLSWTNPSLNACNNNVIVIARQGSAVESAISKTNFDGLVSDVDFTGANATWTLNSNTNDVFDLTAGLIGTNNTNFLVYKGTGNSVTINGLTNGTPYFFRIFTVDGNGSAARWSNAVDASGTPDLPGYYWNGGSISAIPANGGSGTWGTANAWRQPGASGSQATWADGNPAIFSGAAGAVTLDADRSASSYLFNTTSYTLQTASTTARTLTGPITVLNNGELVIAPNPALGSNGTIGFGNVNGSGTASITILGNQTSGNAARVNLAATNSTLNIPTNIVTSTGNGLAGYVANAPGAIINGNITNNSALTTILGATSGNDLNFNGILSGSAGLQISAGVSGGAGVINLNNNSSFNGNTIFNAAVSGMLRLGINNALPVTTGFVMSATGSNGGSFDLNGFNQSITSLTNNVVNTSSITNNSSVSNSTLTINQLSNTTFGLRFRNGSGGRTLAVNKQGSGILTLSNNGHDITGGLILSGGEVRFNPSASPVSLNSCNVLFNGGVLGSSGISASSALNYSAMVLNNTSTISLSSSSNHTINFATSSSLPWTTATTLIVIGWQGTYTTSAGSPGTVGRIFIGNSNTALTSTQLDQIKFFDGSTYFDANLLSNGELVPGNSDLTQLSIPFCGYTSTSTTEFIWADSLGTPSTQSNWRYNFKLVNGATTLTWTTNNQWPIMQFYLIPGYVAGTTYTTSVAWSSDNGATYSAYGPTCTLTSPTSPTTQLSSGSCNSSPGTYNTLLYADFVPNATQYQYRLINGTLSYTQTFTKSNNNFILSQFTGLQNNTTYTVQVAVNMGSGFGSFGPICTVTTPGAPTTQLSAGSCNSNPSSYNTLLYADFVSGATQYQYRLINSSLSYTQTFTKSNSNFILSQFTGLQNNSTYSVDVAVNMGSGFGPFGTSCNVTTPGAPTSQLSAGSCNSSPASFSTLLYADIVSGATQYEFRLINSSLSYTQTYIKSNANFILSQIAGLNLSTTYTVQVRVNYNGSFGPYGNICTVNTPATPIVNGGGFENGVQMAKQVNNNIENNLGTGLDALLFPNPVKESFQIVLTNYQVNQLVTINVFDATGRLIDRKTDTAEAIGVMHLGAEYAKGIYNVVIIQGNTVKNFKVVKE